MSQAFLSVDEILRFTGGSLVNADALGAATNSIRVSRPHDLVGSQAGDISFFFSRAYESAVLISSPGVLITGEAFVKPMETLGKAGALPLWKKTAVIACKEPYYAMAVLSKKLSTASPSAHLIHPNHSQIHPQAAIDLTAKVGLNCRIAAGCVISAGAKIGDGCVFYSGVSIGENCVIGEGCVLFPNVVLYENSELGKNVRIHANSTIGADGFGYAPRVVNGKPQGHQKIYHLGKVVLEDEVEIGANSCVDRATFGETRVKRFAKIDNQVQIGHNATIGEGTVICGGTCVAGSAVVGNYVYVGGITGISNRVVVGDGARVGACSCITKNIPAGGTGVGHPQREHGDFFRIHAMQTKMLADRKSNRKNRHD